MIRTEFRPFEHGHISAKNDILYRDRNRRSHNAKKKCGRCCNLYCICRQKADPPYEKLKGGYYGGSN